MIDSVGPFYQTPAGIVKTYGWTGSKVMFYDKEGTTSSTDNTEGWEKLSIREFPHTRNPRLPYDFDLIWDIKYVNNLYHHLWDMWSDSQYGEVLCSFPGVPALLLACEDQDLIDLIKSTTIYGLPLEEVMTKFELVRKHGLKQVDYALPQAWVDEQENKHGESPAPYFVWCYDEEPIFGKAFCLVEGKEHLAE